jgi:predicted CDP-diglyceride synthetase/phosphatidate cytidylyltransferase
MACPDSPTEACSAELARLGAIERLLELALLPLTSPAAFDTLRKFTPTRLLRSIPIEQFAFILKTTDFLLEIRNRFAELFYELCSKSAFCHANIREVLNRANSRFLFRRSKLFDRASAVVNGVLAKP